MNLFCRRSHSGFTLAETMIAMIIVGILGAVFMISMSGLKSGDQIDRGVQSIYEDLLFIRSRAVSTNTNQRLNFYTNTGWNVEALDSTTNTWTLVGGTRSMPSGIQLKSGTGPGTRANAATNVESNARGLFTFLNNASGVPYVTVTGFGTSKTKSLNVYVGGAIELTIP